MRLLTRAGRREQCWSLGVDVTRLESIHGSPAQRQVTGGKFYDNVSHGLPKTGKM